MKVLQVLPNAGSGLEHFLAPLLPIWRAQGIETHVVYCSDRSSPLPAVVEQAHSAVAFSDRHGFARRSREMQRIIGMQRPDVVHTHSLIPSALVAAALVGASAKVVRTVHSTYPYFAPSTVLNALKRRGEAAILRVTRSHLVCVSDTVRQSLPPSYPRVRRVIHNGVDVRSRSSHTNVRDCPPVVVSLGRLEVEKRFDLLVAAFAQLLERGTAARLVVAGEGSQRQRLQELTRELGVQDAVEFPGFIKNTAALLDRASVFVCTSRFEGLGLSVLEAMAESCPVVSVPIPALTEVASLCEDAMIITADASAAAIAGAMERILRDEALRSRLSDAGPHAIRRHFSASACASEYSSLFRSLKASDAR
jgi:glycosyltransferase involved in cell wall biosynthesis